MKPDKSPLFKAFALTLFIGGVFGLVTCKQALVKKPTDIDNKPQIGPSDSRVRMSTSKSMPLEEFEPDFSLMPDSILSVNDQLNGNINQIEGQRDSLIKNSPFVTPDIRHSEAEKERVKQIRQRMYSSKSFIIHLDEEDIKLLASFNFEYAYGLKSKAQNLLEQLTIRNTNLNDENRQKELVDSLKKAIEEENWKPVKKDKK